MKSFTKAGTIFAYFTNQQSSFCATKQPLYLFTVIIGSKEHNFMLGQTLVGRW